MKKIISVLLVIVMICGVFTGCGVEELQSVASAVSSEIAQDLETKEQPKENQIVTATEAPKKSTIEETVVYENGGVKVTATGIEDSWSGKEVKFLVENTTDRNVALSGDVAVVNGVTMPVFLYINVAAGKKANGTMTLNSAELDAAGIKDIATIAVKDARIIDTDSFETLADAPFEIVTSLGADYVQKVDDSGDVVFEANGVCVIAKAVSGDMFSEKVILLVKNESGSDVTVEAENISVNDFTITAWMYDTVYADTVRFCSLEIYNTTLEENGITEVADISFTINVIDPHSYNVVAKSDEIQIVVNP